MSVGDDDDYFLMNFSLKYLFRCRVFCVKFSCDASYVLSGSDDTNLRLWKAKASEQLGVVSAKFFDSTYFSFFCIAIVKIYGQTGLALRSLTSND